MREFASQKALISYAERKGLIYLWKGTPAFARRQRLLSRDQYELAEVRTSRRGVRPAMLFPRAILEAEWAADAPFRSTGRALEMGCSISDPGMTGCSKSTALLSSCNACRGLMFAAALA